MDARTPPPPAGGKRMADSISPRSLEMLFKSARRESKNNKADYEVLIDEINEFFIRLSSSAAGKEYLLECMLEGFPLPKLYNLFLDCKAIPNHVEEGNAVEQHSDYRS
ncbi:hypothetical protein OROMI_009607 [Orobanche minor]